MTNNQRFTSFGRGRGSPWFQKGRDTLEGHSAGPGEFGLIDWLFAVLRPTQEYFTYMEVALGATTHEEKGTVWASYAISL
jgi:hypothetical protein